MTQSFEINFGSSRCSECGRFYYYESGMGGWNPCPTCSQRTIKALNNDIEQRDRVIREPSRREAGSAVDHHGGFEEMRVLVACEFSGIVRDAFAARGHDAWSCDLLPSERPGKHIQSNILDLDVLFDEWDLMIAHPPCTYLCNSGVRWLKGNPDRMRQRQEAIEFVKTLWSAPIPKICIENPIGCLSTEWMKPTQIIQPFDHGHADWKSTCLWLKGLKLLQPSVLVFPEEKPCGGKKPGRITSRLHRLPPSPDRWKERSRTYIGIAKAMAKQWG